MSTIKFLILCVILIFASIKDIKYREVPDCVSVIILILGLVNAQLNSLPDMLLGAILVFLPQYVSALISPQKALGGADIKMSTAVAFLLGTNKGLLSLAIGLMSSIIVIPIINKFRNKDKAEPFPLIPFLSAGILTAYLI